MTENPSSQPKFQVPYVLSLLVCDQVITDSETQKPSVIGCFSSLLAPKFPVVHPGFVIFAELTDGQGSVPITIRLTDVDEDLILFEVKAEVPMESPLMVGRILMRLPPVLFPSPGEYRLQFFAADEPLMERRILLIQISQRGINEPGEPIDG